MDRDVLGIRRAYRMAATMKDIAKMTGLGLATISKFLNGGTVKPKNKKLIEEAVKELHFVPNEFARSLKTSQSRTVGVVIPELGNQFITSIITTMRASRAEAARATSSNSAAST